VRNIRARLGLFYCPLASLTERFSPVTNPDTSQPESAAVVWGAPAIAAAINRPLRATYHMLESDRLPGAKKIAGRWCFAPAVFLAAVAA
jgi:hypothetical protein